MLFVCFLSGGVPRLTSVRCYSLNAKNELDIMCSACGARKP